ncbi:MAG: hypothetical protein NTU53_16530 [Planctomycetota bacterium]|nr:hypothetical protein [Planctomycetota bacterium]
MEYDEDNDMAPIIDAPEWPTIKAERESLYGGVPGLDEDELADPAELQRVAFRDDWGPVLALPDRSRHSGIRPAIDEFGHLDFGAFGTADFERLYGEFDKARYKADRLAEELRYSLIRRDTAMEHIPGPAKYQVLDYPHRDVIDFDHIEDLDRQDIARWDGRARKLRDEIRSLRKFSLHGPHPQD